MSLLAFFQKQNLIFSILLGGLILRLVLFCGDGLGDDPNYFSAFKNIYDGNIVNSPYYHRFSYWIPQVLIWKIFGINEFTFILPVLLSSIGCIYLVYLIVKDTLDSETGLIAATLMAVNPFEVLNATLISTDVNLSLYILLSVYFFIIAQKGYNKLFFPISSLFAFFAFINKPFGLYVLPILMILFFRKEGLEFNNILKYWFFIATLSGLFLSLFIACWILIGDPLTYITIYTKEPFHHSKIDLYQLKIYPKQMFFKNEFGERLHGFHFYSVLVCFLFIRRKDWQKIAAILAWFLMMFFFVEFLPHRIENFTPHTASRIFRYFVIVIPPSILFVSYFWNKLRIKRKNAFALLFGVYVILSVFWSYDSTRIARIDFGEVRSAIKYLKNLGDADIYSDCYLVSKIQRLEYAGNYNPKLHFWVNAETPEAWEEKFLSVKEGYVVTGGPRLRYYGCCYRCTPNIGDFNPPANWQLIKEFNNDLYPPWKTEPLRIWYVNQDSTYP